MGLSASKKVEKTLRESSEFVAACDSVYKDCLNLSQQGFPGVRRYQLNDAAALLHRRVAHLHLVKKWSPLPPTRNQVDRVATKVGEETEVLSLDEFKDFAVEVFKDAIVSNARAVILTRAPIGIAGITGASLATRWRKGVIGKVMGVYAIGVAFAVYFGV